MRPRKSVPILKWHRQTHKVFPDMETSGVANIVSEAVMDNELEAPLTTEVTLELARSVHSLFSACTSYATDKYERWSRLTPKERRELGPRFDNNKVGYLHELVDCGGLKLPSGFTLELSGSSRGTFSELDRTASIDLVVTLVDTTDKTFMEAPRKHGRPVKYTPNVIVYRLARQFSKGKPKYNLSVKGSGLFLLQGNTDYALPTRIQTNNSEELPTELYLFLNTMRAPFTFLKSLSEASLKIGLGRKNPRIEKLPDFLANLKDSDLQVKGFTFTRYIDFSRMFANSDKAHLLPNTRQMFLKSLFLIYDAAKGNRHNYTNNGMKTYKGITAETIFEDEAYQRTLKNHAEDNLLSPRGYYGKAKTVSDIYGVRLTNIERASPTAPSTHLFTSIYFSIPKTVDRGKLGLSSEGADYLRKNCLRVRFTVFNRFLNSTKIKTLDDLTRYLCKDKKLTTFRSNLDRLFHRVLNGYDYFYWSGMQWRPVASINARTNFVSRLETDDKIPEKVKDVLRTWLDPRTTERPEFHSLLNIVLSIYEPAAWAAQDRGLPMSEDALKRAKKVAMKLSAAVRRNIGIDLNYPLAFHITVLEAFRSSTLHALYYSGDKQSESYNKDLAIEMRQILEVSAEAVKHLSGEGAWHALPMTMKQRELELVL